MEINGEMIYNFSINVLQSIPERYLDKQNMINTVITDTQKRIGTVIFLMIFVIVVSALPLIGAWTTISAGHVGVITRFGAVNRVVTPGFVLKIPLIESVTKMETRTQLEQVDATSASKDLQEVKATIALNFHLDGAKAVIVYQNLGSEYKDRIIAPAMQEAFKATTAKFTASDLIAKREAVKQLAYAELKQRLTKYSIIVDDFNIVNFKFSDEFDQAIEQKTIASQNKERATIEAETALIKAQGEVNAAMKLQEQGALTPLYIEFLKTQKWDGKAQPQVIPFYNYSPSKQ
jgi:regulator of protease activity HflC (stomatin/prohibitin superfamily)